MLKRYLKTLKKGRINIETFEIECEIKGYFLEFGLKWNIKKTFFFNGKGKIFSSLHWTGQQKNSISLTISKKKNKNKK